MKDLSHFFQIIGYEPADPHLFETALTHSSCGLAYNNERLEFLGDAVLQLISSEFLYAAFPAMHEGELSKLRSELVCETALNEWARSVELGGFLRLGKGEEVTGGRSKPSLLSDAVEAVLAAVYLDGGYEPARDFAHSILNYLLRLQKEGLLFADAKTALQELLQGRGQQLPVYTVTGTQGPPHARIFSVSVTCDGQIVGKGEGMTKKQAEQDAAKDAITKLKKK